MQNAIITGFDARRCLCCGGFMVTFSDNPTPYEADYYQWRPTDEEQNFGVTHASHFPLRVKISFQPKASDCVASLGEIFITEMEVVDTFN